MYEDAQRGDRKGGRSPFGGFGWDDAQTAVYSTKAVETRQVKVLVDTSVWIAHFQRSDLRFQALLSDGSALIHSAVVGELACGNLTRRSRVLSDLRKLSAAAEADPEDTLFVIESRRLWGKGIGWTDAQLIASALLTSCSLWSHDKQLQKVAAGLGIAY
jgi:hypothetical protein